MATYSGNVVSVSLRYSIAEARSLVEFETQPCLNEQPTSQLTAGFHSIGGRLRRESLIFLTKCPQTFYLGAVSFAVRGAEVTKMPMAPTT